MPKYVVSSAAEQPAWNNSTVLKGDVVTEVAALKRELGGDIVVYASRLLVQTLIEHDLVDELLAGELALEQRPVISSTGRPDRGPRCAAGPGWRGCRRTGWSGPSRRQYSCMEQTSASILTSRSCTI